MNKKIIALAIAAAVAAPMAAQAAPTVYGKINMGIVSFDDGGANDGLAIFDEASRLGLKGSEDLGGGLKLIYKMEGTADMDQNGGFAFNRDTMVGLKGGFGTVSIGRQNTAYKNATGKYDLFADMYGDITGDGTHGAADTREEGIKYENKFGGVKLAIDFAPSEAGSPNDEMGNTVAVNFKAGPVDLAVALGTCGDACEGGAVKDSATKIGVQWKGGANTVNFIHETFEEDLTGNEQTAMTIQYGMKMGKNMFQLSHTMAETDPGSSATEATQTSVALVHTMSKSTKVYVAYSAIDNGAAVASEGRLDSGITNHSPLNGEDPSGIAFGLTTSF